jgi:hypothetical protein
LSFPIFSLLGSGRPLYREGSFLFCKQLEPDISFA